MSVPPKPPAPQAKRGAPRRGGSLQLPNIKGSRGEVSGMLTATDMRTITRVIDGNSCLPHHQRRRNLRDVIPSLPFRRDSELFDDVTGLSLAPLPPLEPSLDVPLRFKPPKNFHSPPLVDPKSSEKPVQQLFSFMKNSIIPPSPSASPRQRGTARKPPTAGRPMSGHKPLDPRDYTMRALSSRRASQRDQEAVAYFNTAAMHYSATAYEKAVRALVKCVAVLERLSDWTGLAAAHNLLGVCLCRQEKYKIAIHHFMKQETLCGAYGKAVAQVNMGVAYSALDEKMYAVQALTDAVDNARRTEDHCIESIALGNLGLAHLRCGNLRASQESLEACMELCSLSGDEAGAAVCLLLLGEVYSVVRDYQRAQFYYLNALRVATEGGVKDVEQVARVSLGISKGNEQFSQRCTELLSSMQKGQLLEAQPPALPPSGLLAPRQHQHIEHIDEPPVHTPLPETAGVVSDAEHRPMNPF